MCRVRGVEGRRVSTRVASRSPSSLPSLLTISSITSTTFTLSLLLPRLTKAREAK